MKRFVDIRLVRWWLSLPFGFSGFVPGGSSHARRITRTRRSAADHFGEGLSAGQILSSLPEDLRVLQMRRRTRGAPVPRPLVPEVLRSA